MTKHILLIDDDEDERDFFSDALSENNTNEYRFSYLNDSLDALTQVNDLNPDLIFVDFNMPKLNGFEWLKRFMQRTTIGKTPTVIYSTHFDPNMRRTALELGAMECVKKPSAVSNLRTVIQQMMALI